MKKLLLAALLLLAPGVWAQEIPPAFVQIVTGYDLTNGSFTYPLLALTAVNGPSNIKSSGSSTTFNEATVGSGPFGLVSVGDLITVKNTAGILVQRTVVTRPSDAQITVDSAADLGTAGVPFTFRKLSDGTGAAQGWLKVAQFSQKTFVMQIDTIAAASIDARLECRQLGDYAGIVLVNWTGTGTQCTATNFTVAGVTARCFTFSTDVWDQCRIGFKINADAGVQAITASFMGRTRQ